MRYGEQPLYRCPECGGYTSINDRCPYCGEAYTELIVEDEHVDKKEKLRTKQKSIEPTMADSYGSWMAYDAREEKRSKLRKNKAKVVAWKIICLLCLGVIGYIAYKFFM
jgi:hypothetical protein